MPPGEWHGARLAAFLQDQGRVVVLVSPSAAGRAAVLDAALALIAWPVIRTGNPLTSPLTLYRLLIQVGAEDDGGDEGDSLLRCLATHAAGPEPTVLLVDDAHTLAADVLVALARVPGLVGAASPGGPARPGVALILAGGPALPAMLQAPGLESLHDPATTLQIDLPPEATTGTQGETTSAPPAAASPGPVRAQGFAPAVPLPPARAAQVFHPPIDHSIVQIPMPPPPASRQSLAPPAVSTPQAVSAPKAVSPSQTVPDASAAISPIWARPGNPLPSPEPPPPPKKPPAPVRATDLRPSTTPIDEHIMGVRSKIDQNRGLPARRLWLSVAAVAVAAMAGVVSVLAWRGGLPKSVPAGPVIVAAPTVVVSPVVKAPAPAPPPPKPAPPPPQPASPVAPPVAAPPPHPAAPIARPLPRTIPLPARPTEAPQRPATSDGPGLF